MVCYVSNTPAPTGAAAMRTWNDKQPIYLQLAEILVGRLIEGEPPEGEPMPSVRTLAGHYLLNPLTVNRALQALDDSGVLEHRRGQGLYVRSGAREHLRRAERARFLDDEWPRLRQRLRRLGIGAGELDWENP